ncbi:MAG: hypothetical protein IT458_00280 [Planctomycetes bacterium]|nr:hypothetical protein [Planctomycetota bacterium]
MRLLSPILAGLLVACTAPLPQDGAAQQARPMAPKQPKAAILRWQARAGEQGKVPHGAYYQAALAHRQRVEALPEAGTGPANWTLLGPGNIGGRVRAILVHPTNPSVIWVGSVGGGVWKSTNGGSSWTQLPDLPAVLAVTCMVLHPNDPDTIYAGTGEECFFNSLEGSSNSAVQQGAGVFKSTDGGTTWVQLPSTAGAAWNAVSRLAIDRNNPSILVASTLSGIWRSVDGGTTWSQRTTVKTLDVKIDPNDSTKYVAGRADGIAQYSIDGGVSWSNAPAFPNVTRVELAYAKSTPGMVYAATSVTGSTITLWRSTNGGQTYAVQSTGSIVSTLANYDSMVWVDPTNSNRVLVGGLDLYRSTNGGVSFAKISNWSSYPNSAHADQHILVEHPGYDGVNNATVFVGNDGGIQRAANILTVTQTSGWTNLANGLAITQLYGICIHPTSGVVLGGAQDNGTVRGVPANGLNGWTMPLGGDGSYCASDPTDPNTFYMQYYYLNLYRSSNAGAGSGTSIKSGINDPTPNFMAYILLDPNDPARLYACGAQLWRTTNAKASPVGWVSVKPALTCTNSLPGVPDPAHFDNNPPCNISTVAVAKGNSNIVWVGHNNGAIYKTTNALANPPTWTRVDDNAPGVPDRWVSRIVIDANDPNKVTVSVMGFAANNVWRTTNAGASWSPLSGSGAGALPPVPVSCIVQHRVIGSRYYAATDLGLYYTEDDGQNWSPAVGGPGIVSIDELVWRNDRTLVVGTHGRSIWTCDVDPASVTLVGTGCGLGGTPALAVAAPRIGAAQSYTLTGAASNAPVSLLLAGGPPNPTSFGTCTLQPALQGLFVLAFGSTNASGTLVANLPIPADPTLIGAVVTVQEFIAAAGGPLLQVGELSNGARLTFGF